MKSPICSFDAKSGVLCRKCETKLKSGSITQDDVEAAPAEIERAVQRRAKDIDLDEKLKGAKVSAKEIDMALRLIEDMADDMSTDLVGAGCAASASACTWAT